MKNKSRAPLILMARKIVLNFVAASHRGEKGKLNARRGVLDFILGGNQL
ncbi:MAG: hypothetical protein Ta2B_25080 [Termitinemataceae bacterium]|nr:MAG: hypothetical protein Ta2B_25080 [Termitinemataceae bacterium]